MEKALKHADDMKKSAFSFRSLFRLVLDDTGLKPSTVAIELQRERTLMYKWLSGSSTPSVSYFPQIVEIVSKRTSRTKKMILGNDLRAFVSKADLPHEIRGTLLATNSVEKLLSECLELSVMPGIKNNHGRSTVVTTQSQWFILLGALFAAVCGGIVWNALNRVLGWQYFMGSTDNALRGLYAVAWGLITIAPIPVPLLLLYRDKERRTLLMVGLLFTLVGALSALLFYSSGIRSTIEHLGLSYVPQETLVVVIFALCLSIPPLIVAALALRYRRPIRQIAILIFLPTFAALLGFLITLMINRPVSEVLQLRGFVVSFALRLALFFSLFTIVGTARVN